MIELYVNNKLIEGLDVVKLTKAINDVGNLPTRQGEFSNTLSIPMTASNLQAFGNIENINTLNSSITYDAILYDNSNIVFTGEVSVLSVKEDIQAVLISGNSLWYNVVKNRRLRDIDSSALNHVYNETEIEARRLNTSGIVYPNLSKYLLPDLLSDWLWWDWLCCFYINYVIEKIFSEAGYTVSYPQIDELTNGILISKDGGYTIGGNGILYTEYTGDATLTSTTVIGPIGELWLGMVVTFDNADIISVNGGTNASMANLQNASYFTNRVDGKINISLDLNFNSTGSGVIGVNVRSRSTGQVIFGKLENVVSGTNNKYFVFTNIEDTFNINLYEAYVFEFFVNSAITISNITYTAIHSTDTFQLNDKGRYSVYKSPFKNLTYNVGNSLPDMLQSDFLIDLFNRLCLITSTNLNTNHVNIIRFEDLASRIYMAEDWSNRVDLSEPPEIIYNFFENYRLNNIFKSGDAKEYNEFLGVVLEQQNGNMVVNRFVGDVDIYSSELRNIERVNNIASYPLVNIDMIDMYGVVDITNQNLIKQATQPTPTQSAEVFGDKFNMQYHVDTNYKLFKKVLNEGVAVKMLFKLSRIEFNAIDFTKPVYLNLNTRTHGQIIGNFYINEVDQWASNDVCYVTLIKID